MLPLDLQQYVEERILTSVDSHPCVTNCTCENSSSYMLKEQKECTFWWLVILTAVMHNLVFRLRVRKPLQQLLQQLRRMTENNNMGEANSGVQKYCPFCLVLFRCPHLRNEKLSFSPLFICPTVFCNLIQGSVAVAMEHPDGRILHTSLGLFPYGHPPFHYWKTLPALKATVTAIVITS